MKTLLLLVLTTSLFGTSVAVAASAKTYQVTGPIVSLTDSTLVVQKGDEQWEIARDAKTKADSELKVGQKVTVQYRMIATSVDVKTTGTLSEPAAKSTGASSSGEKAPSKTGAPQATAKK